MDGRMKVEEYRELTTCVLNAVRNYQHSITEQERVYALSVISQIAYMASNAFCADANLADLKNMDLALELVLDLIKENPIPNTACCEPAATVH